MSVLPAGKCKEEEALERKHASESLRLAGTVSGQIAVTIAIIFRFREPYAQWEPRRYKRWKLPWEISLVILFWMFMSGVIFV